MAGLVLVVVLALAFDYTNGFHDAANAVASVVSTRALSLRAALAMGAVMNMLGALLGTGVAITVATGIIATPIGPPALGVVFAALLGAVVWNLVTWYFGLPSSSSHALVGGLVGAGLASGTTVHWGGVVAKVVVPMVVSPLIGLVVGYLLMVAVLWLFRRARYHRVERGFRHAQIASAASLALGHGLQDAQKTMGLIVLALLASGHQHDAHVPLWVVLSCATAMAAGSYSGGRRIMRTLGRRIFPLTPPHGFVAELASSLVLYLTAFAFAAPVSTTHVITSSIMGVGTTRRTSAVRWVVAENIVTGWVLTLPAAAVVAAIASWPVHLWWH
ncbi:MAG TPA: inorganic phosphate transporter [Pseudonocardiaceae bacterium]|nr:inorganic phosphate transporter [Pseudonocardiaceae bacterium]